MTGITKPITIGIIKHIIKQINLPETFDVVLASIIF